MLKLLLAQIKGSVSLFVAIGTVAGFISDILQPLAPLSAYAFFCHSICFSHFNSNGC